MSNKFNEIRMSDEMTEVIRCSCGCRYTTRGLLLTLIRRVTLLHLYYLEITGHQSNVVEKSPYDFSFSFFLCLHLYYHYYINSVYFNFCIRYYNNLKRKK